MKEPSIASVKEKIRAYRNARKSKRQAFPSDIISDIHQLLRSHKKSHLKSELQISDTIIRRTLKEEQAPSLIRVAPVLISEPAALSIEVSLRNGQAARLLGLPSVAAATEVLLHLMGGE